MTNKMSEPVMAVMPSDIAIAARQSNSSVVSNEDATFLFKSGAKPSSPDSEMNLLPETVNYHFTSSCNMRCKICFAGFNDCCESSLSRHKAVIRAVSEAHLLPNRKTRRINFVGGEPTVYPHLGELVAEATACGLRASIVTNGYKLVKSNTLPAYVANLEMVGLSIDSLNCATNFSSGRSVNGKTISSEEWFELFAKLVALDVKIKINTVVSSLNWRENLLPFMQNARSNLIRWKIFQAMPVKGQNCISLDRWSHGVTARQFDAFVKRHRIANPIVEDDNLMRGSYAMISPDGCFFDSTTGEHRYSEAIGVVGLEEAWRQTVFSKDKYEKRTSTYAEVTKEAV